jgi:diguanylate cyclase (GGDEF)-like protein
MKAVRCTACGEATDIPGCPSCGADLLPDGVRAIFELEAMAVDRDQTGSDEDQTGSDQDQTWSDHDQASSDRDQRNADSDQLAADEDLAAGGDAVAYRRSALARQHAGQDRAAVAALRDETAAARLRTAEKRDGDALIRDRNADARDELARLHDLQDDQHASRDAILARAARDRARAAADRAKAAEDRAQAAADRDTAARERAESYRFQAELASSLEVATKDQLTGAWTRGFGLNELARELKRAQRTGSELVLGFIDVDGLKRVNDADGHLAGDELLQLLGATVHAFVRPYDVVMRYGGDELLCAMPNVRLPEARHRFESIAAALKEATSHSITIGIAEAQAGDSLQDLIARADGALRAARRPHETDSSDKTHG